MPFFRGVVLSKKMVNLIFDRFTHGHLILMNSETGDYTPNWFHLHLFFEWIILPIDDQATRTLELGSGGGVVLQVIDM